MTRLSVYWASKSGGLREKDPFGVSEETEAVRGLFARIVLVIACLALMTALATLGSPPQRGRASQETTSVGVDADVAGNSATSLGQIDACASVAEAASFDVDVFVADIANLQGWQATVHYDPAVLQVAEVNVELFVAGTEAGRTLNLSDAVPDQDGAYNFVVVDVSPESVAHSGSGALARLSLKAVGAGMSFLTLSDVVFADPQANIIGSVDSDEIFDGPTGYAQVWVGEPCPGALPSPTPAPPTETPEATPEATPATTAASSSPTATLGPGQPTSTPGVQPSPQATPSGGGDDNGFPWAVAVGAAAATLVAAVAAALIFRWLLRRAG